jgi:hypothetical protein
MAVKKKAAKKTTKKAAKKTTKKAAKKTTAKAARKAPAKAAKRAKLPNEEALKKYRNKIDQRLDELISESLQMGEELFGAIDAARNRYTYEWEKMRRRQLSLQMAVWKVRPSRENVDELMAGIDAELKGLEKGWKDISKEVKKAISQLT